MRQSSSSSSPVCSLLLIWWLLSLHAVYDLKSCHLSCDDLRGALITAYPTPIPTNPPSPSIGSDDDGRTTADRCLADERCPAHRRRGGGSVAGPRSRAATIKHVHQQMAPFSVADVTTVDDEADDDNMNLEILPIR